MDKALLYLGLFLSFILPLIVYWIIPTYVSADKQADITEIVMISYSGILFFLNVLSIDYYSTGVSALVILFFITAMISFVASGIFWWIPTYVSSNQQKIARQWLIISASMTTVVFSFINRQMSSIDSYSEGIIQNIKFMHGGFKRRK